MSGSSGGACFDTKSFKSEFADGVATFTLDRPQKINALTFEVYAELRDTFRSLADASEVRALRIYEGSNDVHLGIIARDLLSRGA